MPRPGKSKNFGSKVDEEAERNMLATAACGNHRATIYQAITTEGGEVGPTIILSLSSFGKPGKWSIDMSGMTVTELQALQELINEAVAFAMPIAELRDAQAQEDEDDGREPFERIYRPVPTVHYRKRSGGEHSQGVRDGSEDAPDVVYEGPQPNPLKPTGRARKQLVELHPPRSSPTDNGA